MRPLVWVLFVALILSLALLLFAAAAMIRKSWATAENLGRRAFLVCVGPGLSAMLFLLLVGVAPNTMGWALPFGRGDSSVPVSEQARVLAETISSLINCFASLLLQGMLSLAVWLLARWRRKA